MRTRARQIADMVGSNFVTLQEEKDIVNEECQALYDILVECRGQEYYATPDVFTLPANWAVEWPLPSDYYRTTVMSADKGDGRVQALRRWEEMEYPRLMNLQTSGIAYPFPMYRVVKNGILFLPKPSATLTITHRYIPAFQLLVSDGATFDGINGWEQWVEYSSAIRFLDKEGSDTTKLSFEREKIENRIRSLAHERDEGRPHRIVDTRRDHAGDDFWFNDWDL